MRFIKLIPLIALALGLHSCQVIQSIPFKTIGISETGVIQQPVLAELEVSPGKIVHTVVAKKAKTPEEAKMMAMAQVLRETKSDVLVEPQFESTRKGGKHIVTITAYPALYRSFRSITPEDHYILEHMRYRRAEVSESTMGIQASRKKR